MANFKIAFYKTMGHEGIYSNDRTDAGGETYRGIARRYHPTWTGWRIVDSYKVKSGFPGNLKTNEELKGLVESFYKIKFWNVFKGDNIGNQAIAEEIFDTGVNMGPNRAVKYFQKGLNILNRNATLYSELGVDGKVGTKTLHAFNIINKKSNDVEVLLKIMNVLQAMHYINYMTRSPRQEKYARGWFSRVAIGKIYEKPDPKPENFITREEFQTVISLVDDAYSSMREVSEKLQDINNTRMS